MHNLPSLLLLLLVSVPALSLLVFQGVTGVPPLSSNAAEAADVVALLRQADLEASATVYELGCGWGALLIALARAFPQARICGIEISPLPYWVARWRTRKLPNVCLFRGNFHDCDLSDAQAVTCYLMIKPMPALAGLLDRMLKPGTPVVTVTFAFRGRSVSAQRQGPGLRGAASLYRWPARGQIDARV